jgi:hypothetical protein
MIGPGPPSMKALPAAPLILTLDAPPAATLPEAIKPPTTLGDAPTPFEEAIAGRDF